MPDELSAYSWETIKKARWDEYPNRAFWDWLQQSFPDGFPRPTGATGVGVGLGEAVSGITRGRVDVGIDRYISDTLGQWWNEYPRGEVGAMVDQPQLSTEPETKAGLTGQVTLPSGQTVDVDWVFQGEYMVEEAYSQDGIQLTREVLRELWLPILPLEALTTENIKFVMERQFGDRWVEWAAQGYDFNNIYSSSTYLSITEPLIGQGEITREMIDASPGLSDFLIDWARRTSNGTLALEEGGHEKVLQDLRNTMKLGGFEAEFTPQTFALREGIDFPVPRIRFSGESLLPTDVLVTSSRDEAIKAGATQWIPSANYRTDVYEKHLAFLRERRDIGFIASTVTDDTLEQMARGLAAGQTLVNPDIPDAGVFSPGDRGLTGLGTGLGGGGVPRKTPKQLALEEQKRAWDKLVKQASARPERVTRI